MTPARIASIPTFFLIPSILRPSLLPFSLSVPRNVSEQHKRTKARQEEEEEKEEEREKGGLCEVKESRGEGGKE